MADTGLPLLSGPPPHNLTNEDQSACRKCNKEFNFILTRSRLCNHCGYDYCHSCTDYQAILPRIPEAGPGYDMQHVCAYCIEMLQITASPEAALRHMPLSKLKKYAAAYSISLDTLVEKNEIVRALMMARRENGCLSANHETFYRRYSVPTRTGPSRGIFGRGEAPPPPPPRPAPRPSVNEFARPDLAPDSPPRPTPTSAPPPQYQSRPQARPQTTPPPPPRASHPRTQPPTPPRTTHPNPNPNLQPPSPPQRPRSASQQAPPLSQLVNSSRTEVSHFSIGILKGILADNHVHVGAILEKEELVRKVWTLIEAEKEDRERQRVIEEVEEAERQARLNELREQREKEQGGAQGASPPPATASAPSPPKTTSFTERQGLCVICQDEEANIAIVDCGHLALCRGCSELVMSSTRECPLCRTRIVSDARLLRIFKT